MMDILSIFKTVKVFITLTEPLNQISKGRPFQNGKTFKEIAMFKMC